MQLLMKRRILSVMAAGALTASLGTVINTAAASGAGVTKFGTIASPCGAKPKALKLTSQGRGVTASAINIGYGDDAGIYGIDQEMGHSMANFISWCNAQGGINGRTLVGHYFSGSTGSYPAGMGSSTNSAFTSMCDNDFAAVGQGFAVDVLGEHTRLACNLPTVAGFTATKQVQNAYEMFQGMPNPLDYGMASGFGDMKKYSKTGANDIKHACAVRYSNLASQVSSTVKDEEALGQIGWNFNNCDEVVGSGDWQSNTAAVQSAVSNLQNDGAKIVLWTAGFGGSLKSFLQNADSINFKPYWILEANGYTAAFETWAKSNPTLVKKVLIRTSLEPMTLTSNPAVKSYLSIVPNDADHTALSEQSISSALLFATAAKTCGNALTPQCLISALGKVKAWNAGGLTGTSNVAGNMPTTCGMLIGFSNAGAFKQAYRAAAGALSGSATYVQPTPVSLRASGISLDSSRHYAFPGITNPIVPKK